MDTIKNADTVLLDYIKEKLANQDLVNKRFGAKLDELAEGGKNSENYEFLLQLVTKQGEIFLEDRKQTRTAIEAVAAALVESDKLQAQVNEKIIALQKQNSDEFRIDRQKTIEAVSAVAEALVQSDKLQEARNNKGLDIQQRNLEANVSLLSIFQNKANQDAINMSSMNSKIVVNRVGHKALIGLGIIAAIGFASLVATMFFPIIDHAFHLAVGTFTAALWRL